MAQLIGLNPFEVREVLQVVMLAKENAQEVSIPLKSGRCCKKTARFSREGQYVSIPLKSGRCCKYDKAIQQIRVCLQERSTLVKMKADLHGLRPSWDVFFGQTLFGGKNSILSSNVKNRGMLIDRILPKSF